LKHRNRALIILAVLVVLGLSAGIGLRKTVTLSIDGDSRTLTTYALTVGGLLRLEEIALNEKDFLSPGLQSWLSNDQEITIIHAIPVQIWADSRMVSFYSPERQPDELLAQAGLVLSPGDMLLANGLPHPISQPFLPDAPAISIQILRAVTFSLTEGFQTLSHTSTAATLTGALWDAGVITIAADHLDPAGITNLAAGLEVSLIRARPITIRTASAEINVHSAALTVGEALAEAGVALQGLDYSLPSSEEIIPSEAVIRVVRVREDVLIEQTPLPFETVFQPEPDLELDNQTIIQTGEYGLTAQRVRVRYEDSLEISRQVESEWIARQPQDRIIGYGTQIVMHTAVVDGISIEYWRLITMWATSYHPSEVGSITASGLPLEYGVAAVDIRYVPFFTRLYVPGYGEVIAADTGGGVKGRWIDLGYSDDDYIPWHSYVMVYFLWPPPDNVVWIYP